jgi:hypothetical protein
MVSIIQNKDSIVMGVCAGVDGLESGGPDPVVRWIDGDIWMLQVVGRDDWTGRHGQPGQLHTS